MACMEPFMSAMWSGRYVDALTVGLPLRHNFSQALVAQVARIADKLRSHFGDALGSGRDQLLYGKCLRGCISAHKSIGFHRFRKR